MFVKFTDFDIRIILNFNCIRYFFIDRLIFIIYNKIQFRFIKDIENVKVQFFICDIINFEYNVNNKRVILTIFNILHVLDMSVNFFRLKNS